MFAVGDLIAKQQDDKPLPGVAQLALQSGEHAAKNIALDLLAHAREPFRYHDKGSMATIGRNKAIAQLGRVELSGVIAWILWLTVHILFLVEIRRRVQVLLEWAWAYVTWHRGSRLIVDVASDAAASDAALLLRPLQLTAARSLDSTRSETEVAHKKSVLQHGALSNTGTRSSSSI